MQLSDILEEHSLKHISKKTNISEENIEYLLAKKFEKIERVKALGFISILAREFNADLSTLKNEAHAYYAQQLPLEESIVVRGIQVEGKRRKSKWLPLIVVLLLAYASWYFVTQYNTSHSNTLQPVEDQAGEMEGVSPKDLDIIHAIKQKWNDIVSHDSKEAITAEEGTPDEEETAFRAVVEVVEPVKTDEEKTQEIHVIQIAE